MEVWKEKLEEGVQGFMWQMFQKGHQEGNPEQLEELCQMLIRMASQKTAGQRGVSGDLNWDNMYMLYNQIAIEATCMVLDPRFDEVKELFRSGGGDKQQQKKRTEQINGNGTFGMA